VDEKEINCRNCQKYCKDGYCTFYYEKVEPEYNELCNFYLEKPSEAEE